MKVKLIIVIIYVVLILIAGCATTAYYQPSKTVSEAKRDFQDCIWQDGEYIGGLNTIWDSAPVKQCMLEKGYEELAIDKLRQDKTIRIVPTGADYPAVAGKQ